MQIFVKNEIFNYDLWKKSDIHNIVARSDSANPWKQTARGSSYTYLQLWGLWGPNTDTSKATGNFNIYNYAMLVKVYLFDVEKLVTSTIMRLTKPV